MADAVRLRVVTGNPVPMTPTENALATFGVDSYIPLRPQDYDHYEGEYIVIPSVVAQTLDTENKVMDGDLVIGEIPTYQTSNPYGITFIIGN